MTQYITAKFGGSSLATAERIINAAKIATSNPLRKFIVVSAPGKRDKKDTKITELLLQSHNLALQNADFNSVFNTVRKRFAEICNILKCSRSKEKIDEIYHGIKQKRSMDWVASRGEWLMAQIFAEYLKVNFVDAADIIILNQNGSLNAKTKRLTKHLLSKKGIHVIPGFYGQTIDGKVKTFPRGGSDITGAIIAKEAGCSMYENWTDVDGVYTAQPSFVEDAKPLSSLTFREMRELGYRGAEVIQKDALLPLIALGVPINVKNTFNPKSEGSLIVPQRHVRKDELIVGIAGSGGFSSIEIQKYGLNDQKGVIEKITAVLKSHNVSFEHNPTGLDSVSIIVKKYQVAGKEKEILQHLKSSINPDYLSMKNNHLALICLVGEGLIHNPLAHTKTAALLFKILYEAKIQIHAIISATAGIDIVIAIDESSLSHSLQQLHKVFFK